MNWLLQILKQEILGEGEIEIDAFVVGRVVDGKI